MLAVFSSCAIHNKFPFICFYPDCIKKQFSMKPLKKRIQIAMGSKKRKHKASINASKNNKKSSDSRDVSSKKIPATDSIMKDSVITEISGNSSLALMDTVIRIYYLNLTDSVLNKYKTIIKSFVSRTGTNHISEISLTDYYSEDGFSEISIKSEIGEYLLDIGVSKHRLFWNRNRRLKAKEGRHQDKKLLYLEIRFQ